ncbi:hypothetical protein ANO11243_071990 [Dothideomycetidae sp. 11243]|nr:hypothetical protein ANO11243_071990 [fungal sp. No.11243]
MTAGASAKLAAAAMARSGDDGAGRSEQRPGQQRRGQQRASTGQRANCTGASAKKDAFRAPNAGESSTTLHLPPADVSPRSSISGPAPGARLIICAVLNGHRQRQTATSQGMAESGREAWPERCSPVPASCRSGLRCISAKPTGDPLKPTDYFTNACHKFSSSQTTLLPFIPERREQ